MVAKKMKKGNNDKAQLKNGNMKSKSNGFKNGSKNSAAKKVDAKKAGTAGLKKAAKVNMQHPENDESADEEDVAFFEEHDQYSSFLKNFDAEAISLGGHPKSLDVAEAVPRVKRDWMKKDSGEKLLIKDMDGRLKVNRLHDIEEEVEKEVEKEEETESEAGDSSSEEEEEMEFEDVKNEEEDSPASTLELEMIQTERLKNLMATLSESILENPEEGMKKDKEHEHGWSKMQQLHAMCASDDATIQKLALVSELMVFLDILPGYRIRLAAEKEEDGGNQKQKKAVIQLQDHERALLASYQKYLKTLDNLTTKLLKGKHASKALSQTQAIEYSVALTASKCMSELIKSKFHFNFSLNLIMAVVPLADSSFADIGNAASEALEVVFQSDITSKTSLEIVKQMSRFIKKRQNRVTSRMMKTFVKLPLKVSMERGEVARKKLKSDRKKRKALQDEGDNVVAGLKEAEATADKSEKERNQADILHEVVLIYFRILKNTLNSPAFPAILEGLSKFAFLINLDVMMDVLAVLKVLLQEDTLPFPTALVAILTSLKTLQGPGKELKIDEKEFITILYKLLPQLAMHKNRTALPKVVACVESLFLQRKEIVVDRVAAFIKRLLIVALHLPPHQILSILALVRSLFHKYPKLHLLLDNASECVSSGIYRSDVDDPDFCNPYATSCWELSVLRLHWHPEVSKFALETAKLGPSLPTQNPIAMLERYDVLHNFKFRPRLAVPKKNPIYNRLTGKRKNRLHYISASPFESPLLKKMRCLDESSLSVM